MKPFKMALPKSLKSTVKTLGGDRSRTQVLAGGTDLLAAMKENILTPQVVVNLKSMDGLNNITVTEKDIHIGALVKLADLIDHKDVGARCPALVQAAEATATPQIRNLGTVGGNLCQRPRCWYFRDETYHCAKKGGSTCYALEGENQYHAIFETGLCQIVHPSNLAGPLIAYGARVEIFGPRGKREVLLEKFFITPERDIHRENILGPNEILTQIIVPTRPAGSRSAYVETREKQSFDWALCGASSVLELDGKTIKSARLVLNAVAPRPLRRYDLESMLAGKRGSTELFRKVAAKAVESATPLAHNGYKTKLLQAVIVRSLTQAMESQA